MNDAPSSEPPRTRGMSRRELSRACWRKRLIKVWNVPGWSPVAGVAATASSSTAAGGAVVLGSESDPSPTDGGRVSAPICCSLRVPALFQLLPLRREALFAAPPAGAGAEPSRSNAPSTTTTQQHPAAATAVRPRRRPWLHTLWHAAAMMLRSFSLCFGI